MTTEISRDMCTSLNEAVCIIAAKVFSSCKQKDCFSHIKTPELAGDAPYIITNISFGKAIINNTVITFINDGRNLSRAEFEITAPYTINYTSNGIKEILTSTLSLGHKDILVYIPSTENNNKSDYRLITETYSHILDGPTLVNNTFVFTVGFYEIFKVVKDVQLFIPSFGYCPLPADCKKYVPVRICEKFMASNFFPKDFYPIDFIRPPEISKHCHHKNEAVVTLTGYVAAWSILVMVIEVEITRQSSGNKDYYYAEDLYDNSTGATPLYIDKTYTIPITPPENLGDTENVNLYYSYK